LNPIRHGFVHIPLLPEQAADGSQPSMSLDMIVEGLRLVAQVCIAHDSDILVSGGTIC
ncbi:pyroglutamyl-peptidase I, partial [Marichromatium sp. AB32]